MHWRRKWQPTPVFLPGECQGRRAWWAAVCGVAQSRTRLKRLSSSSSSSDLYEEGDGTPLQYPCLENPMDGGAWRATVHGVAKSRTRLSDFTFTFHFRALEKETATHPSVLAWRIPGTESLVGCLLWGHTESDTTEATQQQQQQWFMLWSVGFPCGSDDEDPAYNEGQEDPLEKGMATHSSILA